MNSAVLIVEDNRWHRKIYSALLKAHDYRPVEVIDPRATVSAARSSFPALIIIDILLPPIDGRTVIGRLRADPHTRCIPILAVSASADPDMADTCIAAGANCFRAKPLPLLTLIEDIRGLLAR